MPCVLEPSLMADDHAPVETLPEGVPPLRSLYLHVSGACNLLCRHCWVDAEHTTANGTGSFLRIDYIEKAVREGKMLGLRSVKLTGGEPLMHPEFRRLVDVIRKAGLAMQIETNGTLMDSDLARFLRESGNAKFVSVSMDGADRATHEGLRGVDGSYEQAIRGIRCLAENGFRPQMICTLSRENAHQLDEIMELGQNLGCGSVKFNVVQQIGRGRRFACEKGLAPAELIELYRSFEKRRRKGRSIPVHFDMPFAFQPIGRLLKDPISRCTVKNILSLLAGGELSLCGIGITVERMVYGHIGGDSLRDVWCHSPGLAALRELVPYKMEGICAECIHRLTCLGFCVAHNFHRTGCLNGPYQLCDEAEASGLFPPSRKGNRITSKT